MYIVIRTMFLTGIIRESYWYRETPWNLSSFYILNFHKSNPFYPFKELITLSFENINSLRIDNPLHIVLQAPFIIKRRQSPMQDSWNPLINGTRDFPHWILRFESLIGIWMFFESLKFLLGLTSLWSVMLLWLMCHGFFFFFFNKNDIIWTYNVRSIMIILDRHAKTPLGFWCRRNLNPNPLYDDKRFISWVNWNSQLRFHVFNVGINS